MSGELKIVIRPHGRYVESHEDGAIPVVWDERARLPVPGDHIIVRREDGKEFSGPVEYVRFEVTPDEPLYVTVKLGTYLP